MKQKIFFGKRTVSMLFFLICSLLSFSQEIPQLDTFTLNNGLKVYLLQYGEGASLSVKLAINGGRKNESKCQVGYSEIIRQLLTEALNEKRNPVLKKENLPLCDIQNGQTVFSGKCGRSNLDMQLELLSSALLKLFFKKEKMDNIVSSITNTYKLENVNAESLSVIYRDLLFYSDKHPLGRSYCQYQIDKVLPEELREFYERYYTPQKTSILVCGNFNVKTVRKTITKQFMKWRARHTDENANENPVPKIPVIKNREIAFVNKRGQEKHIMKWILPAPAPTSQEHTAFLIACYLFDKNLAKKTGTDPDTVHFSPVLCANDFAEINCIIQPSKLNKAIQLFDSTLSEFHNTKFTPEDLQEAVGQLKNDYKKITTTEEVLAFYNPLLYGFSQRKNYPAILSAATPAEIHALLKKYFRPAAYKLVIVGDESRAIIQLSTLKNATRYNTTDFETCDDACRDVVIVKCHCESCWRRGQYKIWQINPNNAEALKRAKSKARLSDKLTKRGN